jgi:hypothetical protein
MLVRNDQDTLTVQHTLDETDDPECHTPQVMSCADLIYHAANLHLYRLDPKGQASQPLWSLRSLPENREFAPIK